LVVPPRPRAELSFHPKPSAAISSLDLCLSSTQVVFLRQPKPPIQYQFFNCHLTKTSRGVFCGAVFSPQNPQPLPQVLETCVLAPLKRSWVR
jgi:hypothetical protein